MSQPLTRHVSVLKPADQSGNTKSTYPTFKKLWIMATRTNPIVMFFLALMVLVVVSNVAVLTSGSHRPVIPATPQFETTPKQSIPSEKVQLAQIESQTHIEIARHRYEAESADSYRRAIFGGIVLAIIVLACVGAFMQMRGD